MGEVLAFSPRPPATDWSANERGLLTLLTQQLTASFGEVDGVFGQTDSGDPWYVVTDANQDVLVHIARIDGQFVVHDAAIDMFHQVGSLWGALRQVMAPGAQPDPGGVVVAFNPASREAQSFLSLVIAVGLYLELQGLEFGGAGRVNFEALPRSDVGALEMVAAKLIAALNLEADRTEAHGALLIEDRHDDTPAANVAPVHGKLSPIELPPLPALGLTGFKVGPASSPHAEDGSGGGDKAPPASEPTVEGPTSPEPPTEGFTTTRWSVSGTAGDDTLSGTAGGDVIRGEAGDDHIDGRGAGAGQVDRLDGGAGDDTIVMNARVVATGGTGADTFVISTSSPADKAASLLGVVLDFSVSQGDHLEVLGKAQLTVVSTTAVTDVLALQGAALGETVAATLADVSQPVAGARVGFDIDGDGREDVYVLLGGAAPGDFHVGMTIAGDPAAAPVETVSLVGQPTPAAGHPGDGGPHA